MAWQDFPQYGISVKNMIFQNSCFPCSLHMILRNLDKSRFAPSDEFETMWNTFQQESTGKSLDEMGVLTEEIEIFLDKTPMEGFTWTVFRPADDSQATLDQANNLLNEYEGVIIGVGHATIILKSQKGYTHYLTSKLIEEDYISPDTAVTAQLIKADAGDEVAVRFDGVNNHDFMAVGTVAAFIKRV
jgi:hypothetical protein